MLILIASLITIWPTQALVMEPTYQAADSLGYQLVGEVEFPADSFKAPPAQLSKQLKEIGELCPRTQAFDPHISSFARFIILAWSDQDYPTRARQFHSSQQQWLAQKRAQAIAEKLRGEIKGSLTFDLVNMANRKPHIVQAGESHKGRFDVKNILEMAGAAPSDALGFGLFAEYSQAAKAVLWLECKESMVRKRGPAPPPVQLAMLGRNTQTFRGILER